MNRLVSFDGRTLNRGHRTMTYDGLDRLRTVASPMYGAQGAAYAYDTLDNLTRVRIGGTATRDHWYCYDAHNQLTNVKTGGCNGTSVMGLGFDERGNLANKNGQTYAFDYGNRLRSATGLEHYRYDGLGRRAMAWHPTLGSIFSQYSRDGRLMYQNDDRRDVRIDYLYLGGSLVASREHDIQTNLYTTQYQHTDALGSPVAVTDANRVVVQKSEYEPYGLLINRPLKDGPGFTGHVSDAATGLSHMQQRYYWPGGIFLSVDPVTADSVGGNFHRYWYANNNPYKYTDPDGREVTCDQDSCTGESHSILELIVDYGTVGVFYTRRLLENALASTAPMRNESQEGSAPLPGGLVGVQDDKSRQQGGRVNNGPLAPDNGGTGNSEKDFDSLTGGKNGPASPEKGYPEGTRIGENGISHRPAAGANGPRIDIPANGSKPSETLHYPPPPPPPPPEKINGQ